MCGLHADHTCGSPVTALIFNTDARPGDYAKAQNTPRPGHADLTAHIKYGGYGDLTGGGHFSGRLTAPLCVAGFLCKTVLEGMGVSVGAHIHSILDVYDTPFDPVAVSAETLAAAGRSAFPVLDSAKGEDMLSVIEKAKAQGNSVGGVVECGAVGLPAGVGEPMFGGTRTDRRRGVRIPAVKGVEFGAGFGAARMTGIKQRSVRRLRRQIVTKPTTTAARWWHLHGHACHLPGGVRPRCPSRSSSKAWT